MKKLYRSRKDKMLGGICGGLGDYLGVDPTLIRLVFVALGFMFPPFIFAYLVAWLIIPQAPGAQARKKR